MRRYRDGEAAVDGFLEDYAYVAWGAIELFQATGDAAWLHRAVELTEVQTSLFSDEGDGGWFSTTGKDACVLLRLKEDYDGAEPSGQSLAVHNLLALGHLVSDAAFVDRARRTLERYGPQIGKVVLVMPFMVRVPRFQLDRPNSTPSSRASSARIGKPRRRARCTDRVRGPGGSDPPAPSYRYGLACLLGQPDP